MKRFLRLEILLVVFALVSSGWATVRYVNPDGVCGGNSPCYTTIQLAINAANPTGDVIYVVAGNYPEALDINKPLTLLGPNAGINGSGSRVTEAIVTSSGVYHVIVSADDVTINGFQFAGCTGTVVIHVNPGVDRLVIRDNLITNNTGHGIYCPYNPLDTDWLITENRIDNGTQTTGNNSGMWLYGPSAVTITNNWIGNTRWAGILTINFANSTVSDNTVYNVVDAGIQLSNSTSNVTVSDNTITNANTGNTADAGGILLYGASSFTAVNVTGNTVTNSFNGVAINDGEDITGKDIHVENNNLAGNTNKGVYHGGTGQLDASGNWWGSSDPDTVATKRTANVDYTPWLAVGTDMGDPGFQGDFSSLWVDDDSPQTGPLGRVQEGVNMVTGSTVSVSPGTYEEQVVVNAFPTPLHIIGLGATPADVVIKGVASMPHEFTSARSAVLSIENTASVEVANLTVDGDGQGNTNNRYCGIAYWNSAGSVHDVHVTKVRWTPANGVQGGVGIYAYNNTGGPYVLNLTDVVVDDYQKGGVTMNGAGLTANLTNVTTTGYGPVTFIAQNGIQFGFGAGGSATNCHATGHTYTGTDDPEATSCGILVYQGSSVTVTGSTLNANQQGVYFLDTDGSVVNSTILADAQSIQGIVGDKSGTVLLNNNPDRGNVLNHRRPSPTSEPTSRSSYNLDTDLSFTVSGCTLTGSNVEWTVGVQAFSGSGNLAVTIQNNVVGNWGIGVAPYTCCGGTISNPLITNNDLSNIVNAFDDRDGYVITPGLWASNCYSDYGLNPGFGSGQYWIYNFALSVHSATDFSPNPNGCIYAVAPHDLVVLVQSPHVVLHWRPSSSSGVVYNVYSDPSSTGAFSNLLGTAADTTFTDSNAVSLPDARRFYLVRTDRP